MSTPTRELEALYIGGRMATNQQRAQRNRRAKEKAEKVEYASRGSQKKLPAAGPLGIQSLSPASVHIRSRTGILYDIQQLSNQSRMQAMAAFQTDDFSIDKSRRVKSDGSYYYGFQIRKEKPESVRIYQPVGNRRNISCSCDESQNSHRTCVHIFWLYDRLHATFASLPRVDFQALSDSSFPALLSNYYEQIGDCIDPETKQLEALTRELNKSYDTNPGLDSGIGSGSIISQADDQSSAEWVVQDMLSVFDEDSLPSEYSEQEFIQEIATAPATLRELVNRESLPATMYGLARHDKILHSRLRNAVDKNSCALDFLEKITGRIKSGLRDLDRYILLGPSTDPAIISKCATLFRRCVREVHEYIDIRAPLSESTMRKAAEVVVNLLCTVCERNVDIYNEITWPRTARVPADDAAHNLYTNLINRLPPDLSEDEAENDSDERFFLLGCLARFAPNDWQHLLGRLEGALDQLVEYGAPEEYIARLQAIIYPEEQTRTAGKRPASGDDSEGQRKRAA